MGPGCDLLVKPSLGYSRLVVWAVPVLIAMMVFQGVWAWYVTRRQLTATTVARQRRLLGQVVAASAGIGAAILAAGVVAFVLAGYNWLALALTWAFGVRPGSSHCPAAVFKMARASGQATGVTCMVEGHA
jgi:hypothetical protein